MLVFFKKDTSDQSTVTLANNYELAIIRVNVQCEKLKTQLEEITNQLTESRGMFLDDRNRIHLFLFVKVKLLNNMQKMNERNICRFMHEHMNVSLLLKRNKCNKCVNY